MPSDKEKRHFPRIPGKLVANLRKVGKKRDTERMFVQNMSLGGVFIETSMDLREGDYIWFDIHLPEPRHNQKVSVEAVVRWRKNSEPKGIGVEYTRVSTQDKKKIETVIIYGRLKR